MPSLVLDCGGRSHTKIQNLVRFHFPQQSDGCNFVYFFMSEVAHKASSDRRHDTKCDVIISTSTNPTLFRGSFFLSLWSKGERSPRIHCITSLVVKYILALLNTRCFLLMTLPSCWWMINDHWCKRICVATATTATRREDKWNGAASTKRVPGVWSCPFIHVLVNGYGFLFPLACDISL